MSAPEDPRGPRRSLLGKVILGLSVALIVFLLAVLWPVARVYREELIRVRRERLDLVAQLLIKEARADATIEEGYVLEALERAAAGYEEPLEGADVLLVDAQGLTMALDGQRADPVATKVATSICEERGGLSRIEGSVFRVSGDRLVHLTPIRSKTGFLEGALLIDTPLGAIDRRVATHVVFGMAGLPVLLLFTGAVMIFLLYRHVLRPIGALAEANQAVVEGDEERALVPAERIPDDEIGDAIEVRNRIYERMLSYQRALRDSNAVLEAQRRELKRWATELEARVREKSAELERAHEHLLRSEKLAATGRLAAGLAHEINNPLASIAGYAEDLQQLAQHPALRRLEAFSEFPESLKVIEEQAYRCKRIIRQLMSYARPAPYQPEVLDLAPLTEGVVPLVEHKARGRGVALIVAPDPDAPAALADRHSLEQVLVNLLVNAFDVIEGDTGRITVTTRSAGADHVAVDVKDTGPGIPEAERRRIFDPFYTTKPLGHGTGLGLAICHALVARMGGRIEVSSVEGEGSTFSVLLPRADRAATSPGIETERAALAAAAEEAA